ncbi:small GTP-binding protein, putative [Trichomonas vaginalis G3]|uniref:Small GTP-binding protein, putative n=1 Tax=Trichomonas vaginalis (strain ATCC PRA-98 / G3) TaxID=412133 RepID=A2DZJ4_TRIV3|nr:GTPase protein [Trichomonas vaginalis G3]EAY14198.1 small GTP-binding protein, putative [Trichomonas vaginalis G3]KAI5539193.1 GTPase protein [Trichomonas vaginalis G3]|eukprot:XP_001326421.1 small GTP-binding protein [Trichomonas vaginalis G3]
MEEQKTIVKVVIVGDADVGKSSIVIRYAEGQHNPNISPTLGAACLEKEVFYSGQTYVLSMWDTAGQEAYRNLVPMYFRNSQIAIIVIDVTTSKLVSSFEYWYSLIQENCEENIPILLAANKIDKTDERIISNDDLSALVAKYSIPFFETSAVTGVGISSLFEQALSEFFKKGVSASQNVDVKKLQEKQSGCSC